jgi:virginiamycin A acetyltransferase
MKSILNDIKTYLHIHLKNKKRFPSSRVESYIPSNTKIGDNCTIKKNVLITDSLQEIGAGSYIGDRASIFNCSGIGNYCSISHQVMIGLENHSLENLSTSPLLYTEKQHNEPARIEHDVLISANAMIMSGVTLGTGCVVGAGSFVNQDIPPYAIVVGSPAKIIRYRFNESIVKQLLESRWWLLNMSTLNRIKSKASDIEAWLNQLNNINE